MKIALNKKSIIQIALLVVLVVVGAGAYLMMQGGGSPMDTVMGLLGGGEEPAAPQASAPAPAKKDDAAIPATPVKGQVHGTAFAIGAVTLGSGTLTLRQDAATMEVRIARLYGGYEVPSGKTYKVSGQPKPDAPIIEIITAGEGGPRVETFNNQYTLVLEFGKENDRKLPGKLSLVLQDAAKTKIAGTFEAAITGFRMINGVPDLSADDTETLAYLALREILKDDPDKVLSDPVLRDMRLDTTAGDVPSGYLEAAYGVGGGAPVVQRFQFAKENGEWRVKQTLGAHQIGEAHPVTAPGAKDKPEKLFPYLAAKKLESEINKKNSTKGIFVSDIKTRNSDKLKIGDCEVTYRVEGADKPKTVTYLFKQKPGGWVLDRTLGAKERLNLQNGRVEKRA